MKIITVLNRSYRVSHFTETRFWQTTKSYESEQSNLARSSNGNCASINDDGIKSLRRQLISLNAWPEAGDAFLELLDQVQGCGTTLVATDYDWLPQVAESAYKGEDIGARYPSIFQKLLAFPELRQKFLQALHMRSIGV
jgi:hypothetical protein